MANNFMQHQFSMTNNQISQLEPNPNKLDSTMQIGEMGSISTIPVSQQISIPTMQMTSYDPGSQVGRIGSHQYVMANMQLEEMEAMLHNAGLQHLQNKRKAPMGSLTNIRAPQQSFMPNKRMAEMEHRPWLQQMSAPNKKVVQMQSMPKATGQLRSPTSTKKVVQLDSVTSKSGPQSSLSAKNQTSQMQSSKARTESFVSVRSKMRESLASALALASQQQEKSTKEEKSSQGGAANSPEEKVENSQPAEPVFAVEDKQIVPCDKNPSERKNIDGVDIGHPTQVSSGLQDFQTNIISIDEDTSFTDAFFVKDDLLQGNGLTWIMETDKVVAEEKEITAPEIEKLNQVEFSGAVKEQPVHSPQDLALEIEAELFKLFGGVNKKYKEKGRSLLFNLKDRNNPELRERVMSGDITPERLCSMTAEELASKELSEWRIAKAEELAQMVVLQDTDVDVRRLVKKTHKGEVQVEVEQDDGISVEVSVGTSLLTRSQSLAKEREAHSTTKPKEAEDHTNSEGEKSSVGDDTNEDTITIPSIEGNDLMQGLMADDEVKDKDLPPIVSLDEFMQSLDSEPPFENLKDETGKSTVTTDNNNLDSALASKSSVQSPKGSIGPAADEPEKVDKKFNADLRSSDSNVKSETTHVSMPKGEDVWEGLLQLSISSKATTVGYFKSGEKVSAKDWPGCLDIKGRVRLNAFEKFLQDLRVSRSRAIMVVHFASKDGCAVSEIASIRELIDSYVADDRVGFAEPAPGVELYFCPSHPKTIEMLNTHLPKDYMEALEGVDNGLIGVVVFRKGQLTSPSHHKHHNKQHHSSRKHQHEKNPNPAAKIGPSRARQPADDGDDEDDVPPGFGPGAAARDEDDLPEFNFSSQSQKAASRYKQPALAPARPAHHIRELIHKYGKPEDNARIRKWNDDDDDDIPEWQPQLAAPAPPSVVPPVESQPVHSLQQHQVLRPHVLQHQSHLGLATHQQQPMAYPLQPPQPPMGMIQGSQNGGASAWQPQPQQAAGWWSGQPGHPGNGQFYGVPMQPGAAPPRQELPRRRNF